MVVLGLILIAAGAVGIVAALFTADGTNVELLGTDVSALALFLIGLGSGVAILWGFSISKFGTKRTLRQRRESKQLSELSEKLDKHEAERRDDDDGRPTTARSDRRQPRLRPGPARASAVRSAVWPSQRGPVTVDPQPSPPGRRPRRTSSRGAVGRGRSRRRPRTGRAAADAAAPPRARPGRPPTGRPGGRAPSRPPRRARRRAAAARPGRRPRTGVGRRRARASLLTAAPPRRRRPPRPRPSTAGSAREQPTRPGHPARRRRR